MNDRVNNLAAISLTDNNSVTYNGTNLVLSNGQTGSFGIINRNAPINAKGLINLHDPDNDTDTFVPVSFASTEFLFTNRESGTDTEEFFVLSPWGTATVTIYRDGVLCQTLNNVRASTVQSTAGCNQAAGSTYRISSTKPILAYYDGNANELTPLYPSTNRPMYGVPSRTLKISAGTSAANISYYLSNSASATNTSIAANADLTQATVYASYFSGPAMKISSDTPIAAQIWNDGDGNDGSIFLPEIEMGTRFGGGTSVDLIAIASPYPANCTVYNTSGAQIATGTATSSNSEVYKLGFGTGNTNIYVIGGWTMNCNKPVYTLMQKATNSEVMVWSHAQMRPSQDTPILASNF